MAREYVMISKYFLFIFIIFGVKILAHSTSKSSKRFYDVRFTKSIFDDFVKTFKKNYSTSTEYKYRFKVFTKNLKNINRRNKKSNVDYGITKFTDFTKTEKLKRLSGLKEVNRKDRCGLRKPSRIQYSGKIPSDWDWRHHNAVTAVRDQRDCGACWAMSAVGAIEGRYAILHKRLETLSDQQLLDCSDYKNTCKGGLPCEAIDYAKEDGGVTTAKDYPYKEYKDTCYAGKMKKVAVVLYAKIYDEMEGLTEEYMQSILYHEGPFVIGMQAGIEFFDYTGGIAHDVDLGCFPFEKLVHAAVVVGYGRENGTSYWILKNSYSTEWGEDGYFRMIRNDNTCMLINYVVGAEVLGPSEPTSPTTKDIADETNDEYHISDETNNDFHIADETNNA